MFTGNVTSQLGHITLRGADNMTSCKLLGKLLHLHIQWDFIIDLILFMQTNDLSEQQP